jgi:hypothetical protein
MTWEALNRAMRAYGAPAIDYQRFAQLYDSDPSLQDLIDNFDQRGVQVKTVAGDQQGMQQAQQSPEEGKPMMAAAAKRAAANFGK